MMYVLNSPQFSVFLKFYQYLWSEFNKNTDKFVYLEALRIRIVLSNKDYEFVLGL